MSADRTEHGATLADRTVLVTGASGLIGSWLCGALLAREARVVALVRGARPRSAFELEGFAARCTVVEAELPADPAPIEAILDRERPELVVHLAAQATVEAAGATPELARHVNVEGTRALLEACRAAGGVERAVVASSHTVYGPSAVPADETAPLRPARPYDASKAEADVAARAFDDPGGMAVATARLANVYGPGDRHATRIVPAAIRAALAGEAPRLRSDGSQRRDLLHVGDAVGGLLAIADLLAAGTGRGEPFNVGTGETWSMLEVAELICEIAGTGARPATIPGAAAEPGDDVQAADARRLRSAAGWAPRVALADGLRRTIDWHRRHPG